MTAAFKGEKTPLIEPEKKSKNVTDKKEPAKKRQHFYNNRTELKYIFLFRTGQTMGADYSAVRS